MYSLKNLLVVLFQAISVAALAAPTPQLECHRNSLINYADYDLTVERLRQLFVTKRFLELEEALKCLHLGTQRFASGKSGDSAVYWVFRKQMPAPGARATDLALADQWKKEIPHSIFAEFSALRHQYAMAWNARGSGYANEVTGKAWQSFEQAISDVNQQALKATNQLRDTAIFHNLLLAIAADGDSQHQTADIFYSSVLKWPQYYDFYDVALSRLVPRWGGSWELVDAFISDWSAKLQGRESDSMYARLYSGVVRYAESPQDTRLDWLKMKSSLEVLLRMYPDPKHTNVAASFACAYGDLPYLKAKLQELRQSEVRLSAWVRGTDPVSCARLI
ncbi:MAG: DUF4034 domain-containing protein [Pseudomonadota bacterium]